MPLETFEILWGTMRAKTEVYCRKFSGSARGFCGDKLQIVTWYVPKSREGPEQETPVSSAHRLIASWWSLLFARANRGQSTPKHRSKGSITQWGYFCRKGRKVSSTISVECVLVSLLTRKIFQMSSYHFELLLSVHFPHGSNKINTCVEPTIFVFDLCACGFIHIHIYIYICSVFLIC